MQDKEKKAFEFGRDFQKITDDYGFKSLASFIANENGDQSGKYDFYKLKPLFDKYGYEETIAAVKNAVKDAKIEKVEKRPAAEIEEVVTR